MVTEERERNCRARYGLRQWTTGEVGTGVLHPSLTRKGGETRSLSLSRTEKRRGHVNCRSSRLVIIVGLFLKDVFTIVIGLQL